MTSKVKESINLRDYLGHSILVTYRDGKQNVGVIRVADSHNYPFKFVSTTKSGASNYSYTESGQVLMFRTSDEDIVSIQPCASKKEMKNDLNPNEAEKDSAVEKMALALLPAVFTSLESDPNLDYAIETAIRGTFLAMFGDDVTGETLNHSVSVIKARISLCVKQ